MGKKVGRCESCAGAGIPRGSGLDSWVDVALVAVGTAERAVRVCEDGNEFLFADAHGQTEFHREAVKLWLGGFEVSVVGT